MMKMVMMMTKTMMTTNDDDDDFGGGGGNGDDVIHDKTYLCFFVFFFSPVVIRLCACPFLDLFHTIYKNTRVLLWIFYNYCTKLSSNCGVFAFLFGFILAPK